MRELSVDELNLISGGVSGAASSGVSSGNSGSQFMIQNFLAGSGVTVSEVLGAGAAVTALGAAVLVAVAAPELVAGAAVYGATSAMFTFGAAITAMYGY